MGYLRALNTLVFRSDDGVKCLLETSARAFKLRVEVQSDGRCIFSYAERDEFITIPQTHQATKGKWIEPKFGLYSVKSLVNAASGSADFDYFRFR